MMILLDPAQEKRRIRVEEESEKNPTNSKNLETAGVVCRGERIGRLR
jgi:hypothetical protein